MTEYRQFFIRHADILTFGLLLTFFSSFGQSFLISLSVPHIMREFGLSHTSWGSLYSLATLCSAATLPFWGRLLDEVSLKHFVAWLSVGLAFACFFLAASQSLVWLFFGIFLVRLTGQGLMGLTASTTMARVFGIDRGKALSVSALGYPLGEFLLPVCFHLILGSWGWRWSWSISALFSLTILLPLQSRFLKDSADWGSGERFQRQMTVDEKKTRMRPVGTSVWKDPFFYLILPAVLAMPFMATGLILNQAWLAEVKSWPPALFPASFTLFALARIVSSLVSGPMVDRHTAVLLFPLHLIPLVAGMAALAWVEGRIAAPMFLVLLGLSMGMSSNMGSALWAERYGVVALGKIKSLVSSCAVFATALSPVLMGFMMDQGLGLRTIMMILLSCVFTAGLLSGAACYMDPRINDVPAR